MNPLLESIGHPLGGEFAKSKFTLGSLAKNGKNEALVRAADSFNPKTDNFFIYGPVGCGKTHIATAIAANFNGIVVKPSQLFRAGRKFMTDGSVDEGDLVKLLSGWKLSTARYYALPPQVLVIDDLGTEKITDWNESFMQEILDARIGTASNGLVVTSNLSLDELSARLGGDRLTSRLAGLCKVFSLAGEPDRRIKRG